MRHTRRQLLLSLGSASGVSFALMPRVLLAGTLAIDAATARLRSLVDDQAGARPLGRMYRRQFPAEADAAVLTQLILSSLAPGAANSRALAREDLLAALERRVCDEFGNGQTVQVGGWILARTEARLCALCE
jgi:hypothetical protein